MHSPPITLGIIIHSPNSYPKFGYEKINICISNPTTTGDLIRPNQLLFIVTTNLRN
jgi:hypothetical protein